MDTIQAIKEREVLETPLLLFECRLRSGVSEYWSTHRVTYADNDYEPRVLAHNNLETRALSGDGIDAVSRVTLVLANADSHFSQVERATGWKGAKLTVRFVFFDLQNGEAASEDVVVFRGAANAPEEVTEAGFRLGFNNRLGLQRVLLPRVRIQRRCPWMFPATAEQRTEAIDGGAKGRYSPFFACGYSAGETGGTGNLDGTEAFVSCERTRAACEERGMFSIDGAGNPTRRFGGVEYLPPAIAVRSYGEQGRHVTSGVANEARYNDFVPLVYGTAWYQPPIVFARNDGNLTHIEVLLGSGEINDVLKVVVNQAEIPEGVTGKDMTATGWFNVASVGNRTGDFNYDFTDAAGNPLGDPYGSMALLSVVVPNHISDGRTLPRIQVLLEGLKLERFDASGGFLAYEFTNNPAWVLLDILRRCGWETGEIDLGSFAGAAAYCEEQIMATDLYGNPAPIPRFQCNLVVTKRRSAADLVRGVRNGAGLYLTYAPGGLLQLHAESTLAVQQPQLPDGSNSTEMLAGGWPAYEFGDGSLGFSGILRRENGAPALRLYSRPSADSPNRYSIEFQDAFNEYQQDSLSLVDVDDALSTGQEVTARLSALGIPNYSQAARVIRRQLDKNIRGNVFVEFETSVRSIGLKAGDIITLTYLKEGFTRQPFRVVKIAAGTNHGSALITAQIHDDGWYSDVVGDAASEVARRQGNGEVGLPRPLVGDTLDAFGQPVLSVTERADLSTDGSMTVVLKVGFTEPQRPSSGGVSIPLVSLTPAVATTGGTLAGGQTLYYALTAADADGGESATSFVVRATVPSGTDTNAVTLNGISLDAGATGFHVYRGSNPTQLFRIASDVAPANQYVDDGQAITLSGPPDENFDHARFYWRLERVPEYQATVFSGTTMGSGALQMIDGEHIGATVRITRGLGVGQERKVVSNDAQMLVVEPAWSTIPDSTCFFVVAESSWRLGAVTVSSPAEFEVPNRQGVTVHVSGRSANAHGRECAYELSPLTRHTIGGAVGGGQDIDVAGQPVFALSEIGGGAVEMVGVGFGRLDNTGSVEAGTLTLHYWNEINSPSGVHLAADVAAGDQFLDLDVAGGAMTGALIQIGAEVMVVENVLNAGLRYDLTRASHGTTASAHTTGEAVYHLDRKVLVTPFAKNFFGSPASGSYGHPIQIPDVRIAAAELFVTNSRGNSESARIAFTATTSRGIRTLSGGQFSLQVEGHLAIEANAAPPLVIEATHAVRDVFAVVGGAPTGAPVVVQLQQDGVLYCELTIPIGAKISNVVDGFGLPPLLESAELTLHIVSVGQTADTTPGADLTVTVRL